jgi:hypothetical protein
VDVTTVVVLVVVLTVVLATEALVVASTREVVVARMVSDDTACANKKLGHRTQETKMLLRNGDTFIYHQFTVQLANITARYQLFKISTLPGTFTSKGTTLY